MRKVLLIILLIGFAGFGQQDNDSTLKDLTTGKWYLIAMEAEGQKKEIPEDKKDTFWMVFSPDGKHKVVKIKDNPEKEVIESVEGVEKEKPAEYKSEEIGTWEFLKEKKSLAITHKKETLIFKIDKISKNQLVITTILDKEHYMTMFLEKI